MARFTALQRVRLKRNIYQTSSSAAMREAFTPGETGFISRVPPNNQHVQHDDNCIYYFMLDAGFTEGTGAYPMDEPGWMVIATEIEDIDEEARRNAREPEAQRASDEYWDVRQPTATLTTPRPTVAPPPLISSFIPPAAEARDGDTIRYLGLNRQAEAARFAPRFTPEVSSYQGVQITGAWLDEQSDRVDNALDAMAYMQTAWTSENPFE